MTPELRTFARALHDAASDAARLPRVLVVDARPEVRRRTCDALARLGCATRPVPAPLDALTALERGDPIDGAVLGPTLTQTRAQELAAFLAETYPRLRVVVLASGPPGWAGVLDAPGMASRGEMFAA
jgi:hypothetical protein